MACLSCSAAVSASAHCKRCNAQAHSFYRVHLFKQCALLSFSYVSCGIAHWFLVTPCTRYVPHFFFPTHVHMIFLLICLKFAALACLHFFKKKYLVLKWGAITRHVALLRNCKDSTCRLCPTLIPFFFSLSPVSPFLSPTDTHPSRSLFLFTRHFPTTPPPVLTNTRTQHAVENNVSESHVLAATGSITRLSRLPVGFIYRKDIFLTRIIFLCIVRLISFLHDFRDCLRVFYT